MGWDRVVGMLFGVLVIIAAMRADRKQRESASWPFVEGEITQCELDTTTDMESLRLAYRYRVGRRVYEGKSLAYVVGVLQQREAPIKYPVGSKVRVYYSPRKPSNAVLENSDAGLNQIPLFILFGIVWVLAMLLLPSY